MHLHILVRIQGNQRRGDGKDCASLPNEWESEVVMPRNLFLALGLDEAAGTCFWREQAWGSGWSVQLKLLVR